MHAGNAGSTAAPRTPPLRDTPGGVPPTGRVRDASASYASPENRRLSEQIEMNTTLLERLHAAEQQHLQQHTEVMNREALLAETRELLNSLNDENAELRRELAGMQDEAARCRRQVDAERKAREVSEHDLKQLNYNLLYQMQEKNVLLEQLQSSVADLERRSGEGQTSAEALASKLHEAAGERDSVKKTLTTALHALCAAEEQSRAALLQGSKHTSAAPHMQPPAATGPLQQRLDAVVQNLTAQVGAMEDALTRETQRASAGEVQNATLKSRLGSLEAACLDLQTKLEAANRNGSERVAGLQRQLDESREASHGLALELLKCRQDFIAACEESDRVMDHCRREFACVLNDVVGVESSCDRAAIQLASLQVELAHLQASEKATEANVVKAFKSASASVRQCEGLGEQNATELAAAQQQLSAERHKTAQLTKRLGIVNSHREQANTEIELLHTSLRTLQKESHSSDAEGKRLLADIAERDASIDDLRAQVATLTQQLRTAQYDAGDARAAAQQLHPLQEQIQALQRNGSSARDAQKRLEEREGRLQTALDKMSGQLKKAQEVNEVLMSQRDTFKAENERLRRERDGELQRARDTAKRVLTPHRDPSSAASTPRRQHTGAPQAAPPSAHASTPSVHGSVPRGTMQAPQAHAVYSAVRGRHPPPFAAGEQPTPDHAPAANHAAAASPPPGAMSAARAQAMATVAATCEVGPRGVRARPAQGVGGGTPPRASATPQGEEVHQQQQPLPSSVPRSTGGGAHPRDPAHEEEAFRQRMHDLEEFNKAQQAVEASLLETLRDLQASNL